MAYSRQHDAVPVSSDDTRAWKQYMEEEHEKGLDAFRSAREVIIQRADRLCTIAAKQLALGYKNGAPFPSHFHWMGKGYVLEEPEVLASAKKTQKKSAPFLEGVFSTIASSHEWDRFATLIIGLTTAQKIVTHWSELPPDDR